MQSLQFDGMSDSNCAPMLVRTEIMTDRSICTGLRCQESNAELCQQSEIHLRKSISNVKEMN
jgi:hypothetical protein